METEVDEEDELEEKIEFFIREEIEVITKKSSEWSAQSRTHCPLARSPTADQIKNRTWKKLVTFSIRKTLDNLFFLCMLL